MAQQPKFIGVVVLVSLPGTEPMFLLTKQGRTSPLEQGKKVRKHPDEGLYTVGLFGERNNSEHPSATIQRLMEEGFGISGGSQKSYRVPCHTVFHSGTVQGQSVDFYLMKIDEASRLYRLRPPIGKALELAMPGDLQQATIVGDNHSGIALGKLCMEQAHRDAMEHALESAMAATN